MAAYRGDQAVLDLSKQNEERDQLINWVSDLAKAVNKIARYAESLEGRITELENPNQNVKLS